MLIIIFIYNAAIRTHSPAKPCLIFVSSRRQTRLTALDLIAHLAAEHDPKQWLHMSEHEVSYKIIFDVVVMIGFGKPPVIYYAL